MSEEEITNTPDSQDQADTATAHQDEPELTREQRRYLKRKEYHRQYQKTYQKKRNTGRPVGRPPKPKGPDQERAAQSKNHTAVWAPQYREDGTPGPQFALLSCPFPEIFFGGARGGGKALPLMEMVSTPTGYRAMGEIKVGDEVHGPNGVAIRVIGVYPQGMEDVFRITLVDGRTVRASRGHLWRMRVGMNELTVTTDYIRSLMDDRQEVSLPVESLDLWVSIKSIVYDGLALTQCIKVDSKDGLFVANDDIITHNTDGAIGKWLQHANRYGADAKGVFFRRRFKQLEEVQARCSSLFPPLGATYHKGDATWVFPNGAVLKLRHLWDVAATEEYQGHSYCVAHGTPVLMADGSYRPIETIQVGEEVMTLEGPKPVTATVTPGLKECVRGEVFDSSGEKLGEQIHPVDHPVLTSVSQLPEGRSSTFPTSPSPWCSHAPGLAAKLHPYGTSDLFFPDTQGFHEPPSASERHKAPSCLSQTYQPQRKLPEVWQSYTTLLDAYRESLGNSAYPKDGQSGCRVSEGGHPAEEPHPRLSCPVVLHGPDLPLDGQYQQTSTQCRTSGISCERFPEPSRENKEGCVGLKPRSAQDQLYPHHNMAHLPDDVRGYDQPETHRASGYPDRYSTHLHLCGEHAPYVSGNAPAFFPSRGDAGTCIRTDAREDGLEHTGEYIQQDCLSYIHPYTGTERRVHQCCRFGRVVFQPCGLHEVFDLTVQDANHYITESQLVNKNSFLVFEEVTNWSTPDAINRMRGTLRSAKGAPVELIMTGNPGGSGHGWVKSRFISPAPQGWTPIKDEETGELRIYIPSRLEDNTAMMKNDPTYAARLRGTGSAALVNAWLKGDWDIVAGGFFDDLIVPDIHFLTPFHIPTTWGYRRSFDWGSAAPASLGIWAVSDGNPVPDLDGFTFPRGSLIRIKEWYTVAKTKSGDIVPNEGLRLTNLALGEGIAHRSTGYRFSGCVADPSIYSKLGRESIYDEMRKGAAEGGHNLIMSPADNNRIGGWQKMRDMLENARADRPEKPGLWVFESCHHWLRTVPVLQRSETDFDDIDTTAEDHCLHGNTLVQTRDGDIKIRDLVGKVGEVIQVDGQYMIFWGCRQTRNNVQTIRVTTRDGRSVICTPEHLILTTERGWVEAENSLGDTLASGPTTLRPNEVDAVVVSVEEAGRNDVFNLEVEHTYALTVNNGLIVHNCGDDTRYVCMTGARQLKVGALVGR